MTKKETEKLLQAEKQQLEQKLKQKAKVLKQAKHDLKIEASLERVRAVAMGMMKADDLLHICKIQFNEFRKIGFTYIRNALIGIFDDEQKYLIDYDYSDFAGGTINKIPYNKNLLIDRALKQMKSATDAFTEFIVEGKELEEWKAFRKQNGEYDDTRITDADVLYYYFYSINQGNVGISSFKKIKQEQLNILKKFRNVFDLAYKRYVDITNAEAQAREAQIETALEKVRSCSLGMHKSEELQDVVNAVFERLKALEIDMNVASIFIFKEDSKDWQQWVATSTTNYSSYFQIPYVDLQIFRDLEEAKKSGKDFYSKRYSFEQKNEWFNYAFANTEYSRIPGDRKKFLIESEFFQVSFALAKNTGVQLAKYSGKDFTEKEHEILMRFSRVFEQAYTRFLDLQKAEAQAREAQIELGLERVRARAMAMQESNELSDLGAALLSELTKLDFSLTFCIINIINEPDNSNMVWAANPEEGKAPESYYMRFENYPFHDAMMKEWKAQTPKFVYVMEGREKEIYDDYLFSETEFRRFPIEVQMANRALDKYVATFVFSQFGGLQTVGDKSLSDENMDILYRFGKVFDLTYTRFNDLQKAEAHAREVQIQLALERVRARTMAMQKSEELPETAYILYQQFKELGKDPVQITIGIVNETQKVIELSLTKEGDRMDRLFKAPIDEPIVMHKIYVAWQEQKKSLVIDISGQQLREYNNFRNSLSDIEFNNDIIEDRRVINIAFFSKGLISVSYTEPAPPETVQLLERFAKVFEQTYTRFLDLQNAEEQARESKIEAALEKVRSRSMAMQKSGELKEVIQLVYEQFVHLNIYIEHTGFLMDYKATEDMHIWLADQHLVPSEVTIPFFDSPPNNSIKEAKEKGQDFFKYNLTFEEKNKFYRDLFKFVPGVPEETLEYYFNCPGLAGSGVLLDNIGLYIENFSGTPYSDEENNTLMRFGKVFQQTYTRFLDLQKAEAQAREAKIEAALERVRSRTMAMQKSYELQETSSLLFQQLKELGETAIQNSIAIVNEESGFVELSTTIGGSHLLHTLNVPIDDPYLMAKAAIAWKAKHKSLVLEFEGQELKDYNSLRNSFLETKIDFPEDRWIVNVSFFSKGWLSFSSNKNVSAEIVDVQKRFAAVFDQTYTRFLDLKKAEAQAREAQIEAALERVRSRSMAMQNSDELAELVATVFTELNRLEFALTSCIIWINNPELLTAEMWVASTEMNKPPEPYYIKPFRHPYFKSVIDAFKEKNKKWVYEMKGEEKKTFQEQFFNEVGSFPTLIKKALEAPQGVVYSASFYNFGALEIVGTEHISDEKFEILHRLGKVFDMSYTRFNDLKHAEAQAKEARIETALERVRSRTLAMQKSDELAETAAVVFRQLIGLGIAPNRLYIGIISDDTGDIEAWATDEDGGKVNSRFTLSSSRNASIKKMYDGWKLQEKSITIDMEGEELTNYIAYLSGEIQVPVTVGHTQQRRVQNIAYFGKGLIGIASPDPQPEETIQLIERFAAVFNLTYTRFNDLKVAEAHAIQAEEDLIKLQTEKKRAEDALTELRTTQAQLIQSEKMASLGELTAGIAHEIQNPLNFVNNFSEVSTELVDEMNDEIEKGNLEDARQIAEDLKQNLEKINHHGKRAGDIVKSMLQHSRSSSGVKEPTNINALADEYLRLAYHGLRAKDKAFNAMMKTDYDESIGNITIIPQDIGRVILNLITNAFYAVNEKKKNGPLTPEGGTGTSHKEYEPTVTLKTLKKPPSGGRGAGVILTVKDNGNGIPQKVLDKIFQPFFTTKPTGSGTGLGLSLSYDIVKSHGGEIKVESKEGEGSEFIIQLPLT